MALGRRHRRTLDRIFEEPTRSDVKWRDVEALFRAVGSKDKPIKQFTVKEGGAQHCQRANISLGITTIADWLREKLV